MQTSDAHTLVVFQLAGNQYAVPSSHVEQITPMAELHCPAGAPRLLAGFLNLAGEAVPVIRLHCLFNLPENAPDVWTPLLILHVAGKRLALLVDRVDRILAVDQEVLMPLPSAHSFNESAAGIVRAGEESILLLTVDRLILQQEEQCVSEFREIEQRRLAQLDGVVA